MLQELQRRLCHRRLRHRLWTRGSVVKTHGTDPKARSPLADSPALADSPVALADHRMEDLEAMAVHPLGVPEAMLTMGPRDHGEEPRDPVWERRQRR